MSNAHVSLWTLAKKLATYPDLLRHLANFYAVPVVVRGRGQHVTVENAAVLEGLLIAWRARPKVTVPGRTPRRRRRKAKASR